jgi:tetratricopeptide (TPR) repeat protein
MHFTPSHVVKIPGFVSGSFAFHRLWWLTISLAALSMAALSPGSEPVPASAAAAAPAYSGLRGAEAVLRELAPSDAPVDDSTTAITDFVASARELRHAQASLAPAQAVERWQALFDQGRQLNLDYRSGIGPEALPLILLAALPRPEAWPALVPKPAVENEAKPAESGDLLSLFIGRRPPNNDNRLMQGRNLLAFVLLQRFDEAAAAVKDNAELTQKVQALRRLTEPPPFVDQLAQKLNATGFSASRIEVPDLAPQIGPERIRTVAHQLLFAPKIQMISVVGQETLQRFREVALTEIDQLPRAPWELCIGPDGSALYDALWNRFGQPATTPSTPEKSRLAFEGLRYFGQATGWRILETLRTGKTGEALPLLVRLSQVLPLVPEYEENPLRDLPGYGVDPSTAFELLYAGAKQTSSPAIVGALLMIAPQVHRTDDALALLAQLSPQATPLGRLRFQELELTLRLAQNDLEPALRIVSEVLTAPFPKADPADAPSEIPSYPAYGLSDSSAAVYLKMAGHAIDLGLALPRADLIAAGVQALETAAKTLPPSARGSDQIASNLMTNATKLVAKGRLVEAESLLALLLRRLANRSADPWVLKGAMETLTELYDRAGRTSDVWSVLNNATQWSSGDLANMTNSKSVCLAAARMLATRGEEAKALAILRAYLQLHAEDDDGYELLLKWEGERALPQLDQLIALDRWEERPLIWKAELLRRLGRLADAETFARQAIALDPTDGEQSVGKRIRGYAVLAAVLQDAGKADDAAFFRRVVESVRRAEDGDALREAGLLLAAREKYEQAALAFADAYCVQWRLAERLHQEGQTAEAEKHYEIAFTRMPEQFGRMATLCFGCENVFGNTASRGAADRVLSRLAALPQPRPQVLLILARLRLAQNQPRAAWTLLQQAAQIDPDYFDALKELANLAEKVDASAAERRPIIDRLLALDPSGKHAGLTVQQMFILGPERMWRHLQVTLDRSTKPTGLLPLPAAARRIRNSMSAQNLNNVSWSDRESEKARILGEFVGNDWNDTGRAFVKFLEPLFSSTAFMY